MTDNISKITKILLFVLFAIAILFTVKFYAGIASIEDMKADEFSQIEKIAEDGTMLSGTDSLTDEKVATVNWLGYFFKFMYALGIIATVFAVGFAVWNFILKLIDNPLKGLMGLLPMVILGIIIFVAYTNASDVKLVMPQYDGTDNEQSILKWTGTGMITMYIFFALAVVSIIYVEIAKMFK